MSMGKANLSEQMALPAPRLTLAITGHRDTNAVYSANRERIRTVLAELYVLIDKATQSSGQTRLHSLLAQGADLMAVELALQHGWKISAPLPFGQALNIAINAHPKTVADAQALLAGEKAQDEDVEARANRIRTVTEHVQLFELAEQDEIVAKAYLESLSAGADSAVNDAFSALASKRASTAARVMIEHSAIMIAIWDGTTLGSSGGTRHTMAVALEHGTPIIWINAAAPENWILLTAAEALAGHGLALIPKWGIIDELAEGRLVHITLEDAEIAASRSENTGIYLLYHRPKYGLKKIRVAVDFLLSELTEKP
jgi:hypothetical protein